MMMFKFQIAQSVEIFKDPMGHYHHWTILTGHLLEGTMHLYDAIFIPTVDGAKTCARIGGFEASHKSLGSQVSSGQQSGSIAVMVWSPAPSQREIAMGAATNGSPEEFHELAAWALRHRPARLIHDRGPDGFGLPCPDCTQLLYIAGPVLDPDFERELRPLCGHPDPYIAGRAQDIIDKAMSEAEYKHSREQQKAADRKSDRWKFWRRP